MKKYKDIRKNESCFFIRDSRSLRISKLNVLHKYKISTFGANRIYN